MSVLSLAFLIVAMGASFWFKSERRSLVFAGAQKIFKYIFWTAVILVFIFLFYQARQQFLLWQSNAPTSYLIPPYQNISYFLNYAFYTFFAKPVIALLLAIIFLILTMILNKKFQERFFEKEELYFGALGIFLIGYPGLIFYLIIVLLTGLVGALITKRRFSAYFLWFPIAIFVILIISIWVKNLSIWGTLSF